MKIAVALSGGVDSSVVAALLKQQGHNVFGLTMNIGSHSCEIEEDQSKKNTEPETILEDVRQVCEKIDIPYKVIQSNTDFRNKVFLEKRFD